MARGRRRRRRTLRLVVLLALAAAVAVALQRRRTTADTGPATTFTPDDPTPAAAPTVAPVAASTPVGDEPRWRPPIDGACPDGFPVKANASSGIFHVPGGRFYERTRPERCYATDADAIADGYRRAKA